MCAQQSTGSACGPIEFAFLQYTHRLRGTEPSIRWKEQVDLIGHFTMTTHSSNCPDNSL